MSGVEVVGRLAGSVQGVEEGEMEGERGKENKNKDVTALLMYHVAMIHELPLSIHQYTIAPKIKRE